MPERDIVERLEARCADLEAVHRMHRVDIDSNSDYPLLTAAAAEIRRLRSERGEGWVAVSDPPPRKQRVLVCFADDPGLGVLVAYRGVVARGTHLEWLAVDPGGNREDFYILPSHWRHLPPAPSEEPNQ